MSAFLVALKRLIRFCLGSLIWAHALFLVNPQIAGISRIGQRWLHLTTTELLAFVLLVLFSFVAGDKFFWEGLKNLAYIYFFPFVLLFHLLYLLGRGLYSLGKWFHRSTTPAIIEVTANSAELPAKTDQRRPASISQNVDDAIGVLLRPFKRFTVVWCFLLVAATHAEIVWLALAVVLIHTLRSVVTVVRLIFFSGGWFATFENAIRKYADEIVGKLQVVSRETPATDEWKQVLTNLRALEIGVRFLENRALLDRWIWLFGGVFLGCVYMYIGFVFSFAYFGIAKVSGITLSWAEAMVSSMFIPFLIGDLPRSVPIKLLAGIHCLLVVSVGAGTLITYLRRRMDSIVSIGALVAVQLREQAVREKYSILEEKFRDRKVK